MAGPSTQRTHTGGDWPDYLKPLVEQTTKAYGGLIFPEGQLRPYSPELDQRVAAFLPEQQAALQGIYGVAGQQGGDYQTLLNQAQATARGDYLSPESNPYLKATYDAAARGLTDQYTGSTAPGITAEALRSGAFGGSAQQEYADRARFGLGQNLSDLATQVYGGNYQSERDRQLQTQAAMPGLLQAQMNPYEATFQAGGLQQAQTQSEYDAALRNAMQRDQYQLGLLSQAGTDFNTFLGPASKQYQVTRGTNPMLSGFGSTKG